MLKWRRELCTLPFEGLSILMYIVGLVKPANNFEIAEYAQNYKLHYACSIVTSATSRNAGTKGKCPV